MLTSKKVVTAINKQIGNEFGASMQYVAIAAYFSGDALPQLAQHFYRQAAEENDHAMRFIKYLTDAGGRVVIPAIGAPQPTFKNAEEAIKLSLDQEIEVTHQINALVELARSENDFITNNFLQWFLTEQLEEVSSMDTLLKIVQRGADNLLSVEEYLARVGVKGAGPVLGHGITRRDMLPHVLDTRKRVPCALFHRHAFREVPRLVDIATEGDGEMIGEELHRDHGQNRHHHVVRRRVR